MARKKGRFRERVTQNAHRQQTQGSQYGYLNLPQNVRVFREEIGAKVRLDFIPYTVTDENHPDRDGEEGAVAGDLWYRRPYKVHRNVGVEQDAVVCPTSIGKKCPICEYRQKRVRDGDADKDELKSLQFSKRNLYVVIPRDHKKFDEEPHIWDVSQFLFQNKLNEEIAENDEFGAFPDPDEGFTLRIRFGEGSIGSNKFAETSRIDFDERDAIPDKELDAAPNLDEVLNILSYDELQKKFFELEGEEDGDDDRERRRGRSRRGEDKDEKDEKEDRPSRSRDRGKDDDEDDPPRRSSRGRDRDRGKDKDDDEDGDREESSRSRRGRDKDEEPEKEERPPRERETRRGRDRDKDEDEPDRDSRRSRGRDRDKDKDESSDEDDPPRRGRGRASEKDEDDGKKKKGGKAGEDECPHGYEFGVDTDEHKECDHCELWERCMDAKEERA